MKIEAGTSADVKPDGGLVMDQGPPPKPLNETLPPPTEDMATQLAHMARDQNYWVTWEGARAALLRAMQLTREWERDEQRPRGE